MKTGMIISDAPGATAHRIGRAPAPAGAAEARGPAPAGRPARRTLPKADLVLVGISRTSKTPLSTYLAQRGLKVANVPLVLGVDPPEELTQVDDRKVFGLIVQPDMLMRIRQARLSHLGMPQDSSYGQRTHIENEIAYAREIFRKHANWPVIDVTNRATEEAGADSL